MDPQAFLRLSVGSLGIRVSGKALTAAKSGIPASSSPCVGEIRLRGFPVQTTPIPFVSSPEETPNPHSTASSFYLEESDLKSLLAPGCFYAAQACLEIAVFIGRKGSHCGGSMKRQQIGTFKLNVGPEWGEGKAAVLFNGWIGIGKNRGGELHLCVTVEPDPRYVFEFEDETKLSPQVVQLRGNVKQPIFSCKFSCDRDIDSWCHDGSRRERKGWKVKIHDLSGTAVAAAFITTPFVPSTGCDWVAKSNPGAWLIVRPDTCRSESWQPWGKLEAWRERGHRDSIWLRFHVLSEGGGGGGGGEVLMSEIVIGAEKGGEFSIDTDRRDEFAGEGCGFVMRCGVPGEGKCRKPPIVQLAMRHVTCVEDAAMFMALAAAVNLSIEACRPFRRSR